jgi:hypothetical protein
MSDVFLVPYHHCNMPLGSSKVTGGDWNWKGLHQLSEFADDVSLLGRNMNVIKRNNRS